MARASALHAEGQRFESVILHTEEYIDIKGKETNERGEGGSPSCAATSVDRQEKLSSKNERDK